MQQIEKIEAEIEKIQARNRHVEKEKAWETSKTCKFIILILTYLVISLFFLFAELPRPFINSIVPTLAFVLSTASLPFFKKIWEKYIQKS